MSESLKGTQRITPQEGEYSITPKVAEFIQDEADVAYRELAEMDEDTAVAQSQLIRDLRTGEYQVLTWIEQNLNPETVLYPWSSSDIIPREVFSENKVIHLSLEGYGKDAEGNNGNEKPFERMGSGIRVIADTENIPLDNESVDLVVALEGSLIEDPEHINELRRVLKNGGRVLVARDFMFYDTDEQRQEMRSKISDLSEGFEFQRTPDEVTYQGNDVTIEYYFLTKE